MQHTPDAVLEVFRDHFTTKGWEWVPQRKDLGWATARLTRTTKLRVRVALRGQQTGWKPGTFALELWRVEVAPSLSWRNLDNLADAERILRDFNHPRNNAPGADLDQVLREVVFTDHMTEQHVAEVRAWFYRVVRVWVRDALPIGRQIDVVHEEDLRGSNRSPPA